MEIQGLRFLIDNFTPVSLRAQRYRVKIMKNWTIIILITIIAILLASLAMSMQEVMKEREALQSACTVSELYGGLTPDVCEGISK